MPENREYICRVVDDIVSRYDVDGVHIDDYFIHILSQDSLFQTVTSLPDIIMAYGTLVTGDVIMSIFV